MRRERKTAERRRKTKEAPKSLCEKRDGAEKNAVNYTRLARALQGCKMRAAVGKAVEHESYFNKVFPPDGMREVEIVSMFPVPDSLGMEWDAEAECQRGPQASLIGTSFLHEYYILLDVVSGMSFPIRLDILHIVSDKTWKAFEWDRMSSDDVTDEIKAALAMRWNVLSSSKCRDEFLRQFKTQRLKPECLVGKRASLAVLGGNIVLPSGIKIKMGV
jgi:hypothetical protein